MPGGSVIETPFNAWSVSPRVSVSVKGVKAPAWLLVVPA